MHNTWQRRFLEVLARSANSGASTEALYLISFCGSWNGERNLISLLAYSSFNGCLLSYVLVQYVIVWSSGFDSSFDSTDNRRILSSFSSFAPNENLEMRADRFVRSRQLSCSPSTSSAFRCARPWMTSVVQQRSSSLIYFISCGMKLNQAKCISYRLASSDTFLMSYWSIRRVTSL